MFRMDFGKRSVRPFPMGGPSIGARISCSNDTKLAGTPDPSACNSSAIPSDGDRYARTDLSAIGAIGVEFHRPRYDFGMQVRGNGAFTHLLKAAENRGDARNRRWTVLITIGK